MSQKEKLEVNSLIDTYIIKSPNIVHIFFLVDIRHKPTNDDILMLEWLNSKNIPYTIIANKADKIAKTKADEYTDIIAKSFNVENNIIPFSSETKINLDKIEKIIKDLI